MSTITRAAEFHIFIKVQNEVIEAIKAGDQETVHWSLLEIETMGANTMWPRLRQAAADFLHLHAEHVPTQEVRDARALEHLQQAVEEAIEENETAIALTNLEEIENIYSRSRGRVLRTDAAALLYRYAPRAELDYITA